MVSMFASILILSPVQVHGDNESGTPATPKPRPTSQNLRLQLSKQQKEANQEKSQTSKSREQPIEKNQNFNIADESTLLASKGFWTPLPTGTVIYIPNHLKSKIVTHPTGKISDWKQFLYKNRGWIHLLPVTMDQARGSSRIKADVIKAYQSMGKVVIATYQNNPVSVMPKALIIPKEY